MASHGYFPVFPSLIVNPITKFRSCIMTEATGYYAIVDRTLHVCSGSLVMIDFK